MGRQVASAGLHVQAQNFARLALRNDFARAAADLAVGRETLKTRARVNHDLEALPAVRTLDGLGDFHN
jgi:hypothetical protein